MKKVKIILISLFGFCSIAFAEVLEDSPEIDKKLREMYSEKSEAVKSPRSAMEKKVTQAMSEPKASSIIVSEPFRSESAAIEEEDSYVPMSAQGYIKRVNRPAGAPKRFEQIVIEK